MKDKWLRSTIDNIFQTMFSAFQSLTVTDECNSNLSQTSAQHLQDLENDARSDILTPSTLNIQPDTRDENITDSSIKESDERLCQTYPVHQQCPHRDNRVSKPLPQQSLDTEWKSNKNITSCSINAIDEHRISNRYEDNHARSNSAQSYQRQPFRNNRTSFRNNRTSKSLPLQINLPTNEHSTNFNGADEYPESQPSAQKKYEFLLIHGKDSVLPAEKIQNCLREGGKPSILVSPDTDLETDHGRSAMNKAAKLFNESRRIVVLMTPDLLQNHKAQITANRFFLDPYVDTLQTSNGNPIITVSYVDRSTLKAINPFLSGSNPIWNIKDEIGAEAVAEILLKVAGQEVIEEDSPTEKISQDDLLEHQPNVSHSDTSRMPNVNVNHAIFSPMTSNYSAQSYNPEATAGSDGNADTISDNEMEIF